MNFQIFKVVIITQNMLIVFQLWHFPPIFIQLKSTCLVTLFGRMIFQKLAKIGHFNELLSPQNVNVARFAHNVE